MPSWDYITLIKDDLTTFLWKDKSFSTSYLIVTKLYLLTTNLDFKKISIVIFWKYLKTFVISKKIVVINSIFKFNIFHILKGKRMIISSNRINFAQFFLLNPLTPFCYYHSRLHYQKKVNFKFLKIFFRVT